MASTKGIEIVVKYGEQTESILLPTSTSWDTHTTGTLLHSLRLAFGIPAEVDLQLRREKAGEKGAILDLTGIVWPGKDEQAGADAGPVFILEEVTPLRGVFDVKVQQKMHDTTPDILAPVQVRYFTVYSRHFVEIAVHATASCSKKQPLQLLRVAVAPAAAVQQKGGDANDLTPNFGLVTARPQFEQRSTTEMKGSSFGFGVSASASAGVTATAGVPTASAGVSAGGGLNYSKTSSKSRLHHDFEVLLGINSRTLEVGEEVLVPKWSLVLSKQGKKALAKVLDHAPPKTRMSVSEEFVSVWEITPAMAENGKVTVSFNIECQAVCELPLKERLKRSPWARIEVNKNLTKLYFQVSCALTQRRIAPADGRGERAAVVANLGERVYPCWQLGQPEVTRLMSSDGLEATGDGKGPPPPTPNFLQEYSVALLCEEATKRIRKIHDDLADKTLRHMSEKVGEHFKAEGVFDTWKNEYGKMKIPDSGFDSEKLLLDIYTAENTVKAPSLLHDNDVKEEWAQEANQVAAFSVEELFQHLAARKDMATCAHSCRDNGVDGAILLTLEEEDLKEELGLRLGDRRRLLAHIEELLAGVAESSG